MAIKRPKPEEIGVTEQSYYRWKIGASQRYLFERDAQRTAGWARNSSMRLGIRNGEPSDRRPGQMVRPSS